MKLGHLSAKRPVYQLSSVYSKIVKRNVLVDAVNKASSPNINIMFRVISLTPFFQGFTSDLLSRFVSALLDTMPEPLNVCYLTNSGSEANDLSLRLASSHTGREDIVVLEDGYHGNIGSLIDASPKMHQRMNHKKKDHIHIARLPDLYRGKYRYGDEQAGAKYAKDLEEVILQAESKGRRIGAFLFEPMLVIPGVYMPPPSYYQNVFRWVSNVYNTAPFSPV